MAYDNIAIIGGSGVYSIFEQEEIKEKEVETPFGKVTYSEFEQNSRKVYFLPRHGKTHSIPPHKINFKANIYSLFLLGVKNIISTNAVGSLRQEIKPGEFVLVDQFIDLVSGPTTFFEGNFEVTINNELKKGVVHTDMTQPYSEKVRSAIQKALENFSEEKFHPNGCYVMFKGPRFESSAEIAMFKNFGHVVGMTGAPEVILSRELGLDYASLNVVTNFAAGLTTQREISHAEVMELFDKKVQTIQIILKKTLDYNWNLKNPYP